MENIEQQLTRTISHAIAQTIETNYWKWDLWDHDEHTTVQAFCDRTGHTPEELFGKTNKWFNIMRAIEDAHKVDCRDEGFDKLYLDYLSSL